MRFVTLRVFVLPGCILSLGFLAAPTHAAPSELQTIAPRAATACPGLPGIGEASTRSPQAPPVAHGWMPARDPALRDGWPVDLQAPGAGFPYTPTLYDADFDGADEIFLTGGDTFGLRGDGTFLPGWPTSDHVYMGYGTNGNKPGPAIADLDHDGDCEILWT